MDWAYRVLLHKAGRWLQSSSGTRPALKQDRPPLGIVTEGRDVE
jgi:hypothetical protein